MERLKETLESRKTPNEILGVEGLCSNIYFHSYRAMFKSSIRFEKRTRRPPRDPANIMLSLTYTFLTKEVVNVLEAESFEVCLGFLHGIRYGRKSLALDLVEEFRQPAADRLVLKLFNKKILSEYDFAEDETGQITLQEEGFARFCQAYEKWMTGKDASSGEKSFRNRIRQQAAEMKSALKENRPYEPYRWKQHVPDQL
jgi:CRISPR-associated protein Cas1